MRRRSDRAGGVQFSAEVPAIVASAPAPPTRDIGPPDYYWGTWGQGLLSEWWETSADLIWPTSVITYGKMRHDPQIKAVLSAFIHRMLRATGAVAGEGGAPKITRHVADALGLPIQGVDEHPGPARRRGITWHRHLRAAAQKLIFGDSLCERRYELDETAGLYHLASLGPRMPWTLANIHLNHDGTVMEVRQTTQEEPIPGERLVWYAHEMEGSQWAGISMLRPAFGAWLLKHETWRVHATSIRRFGMGVPTVETPPGATQAQVTQAQALASAIRAGDQTGAGIPAGFKFGLSGMTGSVPDALAFIKYLDQQMSKMCLAGIVDLGQTEIGSRALGESFLALFVLALQGLADEIATETTSGSPGMPGAVTDLVTVNWGEDEPCPRVVCPDIGQEHEPTAQALMWLMQFGAITADPELEAYIRQAWRLPQRKTPQPAILPKPPGQPGTAPGAPGVPAPTPAAGRPLRHLRARGALPRAAVPGTLRRKLTAAEVRAGFDPVTLQSDWQAELDWLLAQWTPVFRAQRDSLVDQVIAQADSPVRLSGLKVDSKPGAQLLADAMATAADKAKAGMIAEAQHQGVTVSDSKAKISASWLGKVAAAAAAMAGGYVAAQAAKFALQVAGAIPAADAGDFVAVHLDGLSQRSLRDQLGAALSAAQNAGRLAVLEAAPESAGQAEYIATELLDDNTCEHCTAIDGTVFRALDEAGAASPDGGYIEGAGFHRCRGTVMGIWGGEL